MWATKGKEITGNLKPLWYKARMSEKEIQDLQETVSHHEQQINDLSDILIVQSKLIETLKKDITKMQGKIETLEDGAPEADQKPPHY